MMSSRRFCLPAGVRISSNVLLVSSVSRRSRICGVRASAFAYGMLEALRDTRITIGGRERHLGRFMRGSGSDALFGDSGNDRIAGAAGNDYVQGGHGNDHLTGGRGNDHLIGDPALTPAEVDVASDVVADQMIDALGLVLGAVMALQLILTTGWLIGASKSPIVWVLP